MKAADASITDVPEADRVTESSSSVEENIDAAMPEEPKPSAWNNKLAVLASWLSFFMFGMSDGTIGALLPSIQKDYDITYTVVSLVFFSQVIGYGIIGLASTYVLAKIGRCWGVLSGCGLFIIGLSILVAHPPHFAGVIFGYIFLGFAAGFFESILNAFLGSFRESNAILGCLHGFYGLGCAVAPISATQWLAGGLPWFHWYAVLLGLAALVAGVNTIAFRKHSKAYCSREESLASKRHTELTSVGLPSPAEHLHRVAGDNSSTRTMAYSSTTEKTPLKAALTNRFCIVGAVYMFCYLALEISTGGFVLTFLTRQLDASETVAGYANTGFWLGLTLGRFVLTPIANLIGPWLACQVFTATGLCCILTFWLAPTYIGSSIGISLTGFFIGPTFPLIMQIATDFLPPRLHVAGIGLIASVGSMGGAIFPLIVGVIATSRGPGAIPPILLALSVALLAIWMFLPGPKAAQLWKLTRKALGK